MVTSGEESSFQSILSVFSLQVSSKLPRLSTTSCCHVANYVSIVWAPREKKIRKKKEEKQKSEHYWVFPMCHLLPSLHIKSHLILPIPLEIGISLTLRQCR